jgi:hypothetical protein
MMNHVYEGARMTIIALDSEDADQAIHGVGSYNPARQREICKIEGLRFMRVVRLFKSFDGVYKLKSTSPWNIRAWTMQERLLSRRRLYMSSEQAYFSCVTAHDSEDRIEGDVV